LAIVAAYVFLSAANVWAEPLGVDAPATTAPTEKIPEVDDALQDFRAQNFAGAVKKLESAVKSHPDLPPPQLIMAQWFSQANLPGGVRASLERAVVDTPADPEAYVILGDIAINEGRVAEADLLYSKASTLLEPFKGSEKRKQQLRPRVLNGLARITEVHRDWPTAQKYLEAWLKLEPKDANVMQRLAQALFQQGKRAPAYDMLKEAKKNDSTVLTPEAQLGQFYEYLPGDEKEKEKNHADAKKWMLSALGQAPKDLRTRLVITQWALETGEMKEAKENSVQALTIDPKSLEARILRGVVALFEGDYKGAETYFQEASIQSPSSFPASNNLALALVEQDDEAKKRRALEVAQNNAQQYPRLAEAASTYGWVLYRNGQRDRAEQALRLAASSGNISPDTAYYLAEVLNAGNRPDDAKVLLKAALDTKRPFSKKKDATALLEKLEKVSGSAEKAGAGTEKAGSTTGKAGSSTGKAGGSTGKPSGK